MKYSIILTLAILLSACGQKDSTTASSKGYVNADIQLKDNKLSPELLWEMGRIGSYAVSPDQSQLAYTVAYTNISENKSYTDIYLYDFSSSHATKITDNTYSESELSWHPTNGAICFLSNKSGDSQLCQINADGTKLEQLSTVDGGINGYKIAKNGKQVAFIKNVKLDKDIQDRYPDLQKANAHIEDDLMYRHWDAWADGTYSHVFVSNFESNSFSKGTDIMDGELFDSPLKPFGGTEQIAISNDGTKIIYTCKKLSGKEYAVSTNSDLYMYDLNSKTTTNLTKGMMGYDMNPVFSPDGKTLAWESLKRDGYESDKSRLFCMDIESGNKTEVTKSFDQNASSLSWDDNSNISFISEYLGCKQIYTANIKSFKIKQITDGIQNFNWCERLGDKYIASKTTMSSPTELVSVNINDNKETNLSNVNTKVLDQLKFGKVEERWIKTTDKKDMLTWVIYPPDFDPNKKYPTLLYCQGGPQSMVSQSWSLRWNFQLMAAKGYIIVAPNRRGLPGFGQKWNEQISGDYGGQNMKDYLSAIDALSKESYVDADRLGAIGASYGGFSVYWLAGNHHKRFKTFIAHCGIFNFEQMYSTTEEMFFVNWDLKGSYWDKDNAIAQRSYANSPHKFVGNWDTPIMIITGENDFRIPYTQGLGAFNTARLRGLKTRLLDFPDECHWVLQPQNGILWHREFFRWLDETL